MAYKKFLFLGTTGVITEQDTAADGIEVNSLKVNTLSTGVAHFNASGVMSSSEVATDDIAAKAVTSGKLADGAVGSTQLATDAVIEGKIAASAVTTAKISDGAITTDKLGSAVVTSDKLGPSAVIEGKIADGAVSADKLAALAVTTAKIAALAVTNAKLAGEISDDKLLSGVSSSNDSGKIVKRDGSGDFYAGTIHAALSGNASTSSKWASSVSVDFAGGDVTGSFSGLDGSSDISNVNLTIGALKVTNAMLAGSIEDSKLNQISTAGKVADTALTSNVALLNRNGQQFTGTTPSFSNALSVGTPTLGGHATTKTYVDDAVAAATSGLDYKQEAKWYFNLANLGGSVSAFISELNSAGAGLPFVSGDRALLNDESAANVDVGIYVFGGGTGNWTLTRAADYDSGTSATGAWIYCLQKFAGNPPSTQSLNTAYVCPTQANVGQAIQFVVYAAGQTYTGTAPIVVTGTAISLDKGNGLAINANKLVVQAAASSAISVSASGVAVDVDDSTIQIDSNQIKFKSLPSQFKINGSATSTNVTSANLGTLTGGATGNATTLHRHEMGLNSLERDSGEASFVAGTPVIVNSSGKLVRASKAGGKCVGLAYSDELGAVLMASSGVIDLAAGIWTSTAPANGEAVYLGDSGKLAKYGDLGSGDYVTKVGRLVSGSKLALAIQDVGLKA